MKKKILVLLAFMMSMVSAQAADWQFVETNNPNLSLYIDLDSIKKTVIRNTFTQSNSQTVRLLNVLHISDQMHL